MENTKEIKINIPEGYEIDKKNSTFENIILKKIEDKKPKSWKEYQLLVKNKLSFWTDAFDNLEKTDRSGYSTFKEFDTKEEAKAFCALGKLIQLRDAWRGDWKPDWTNENQSKHSIHCRCGKAQISLNWTATRVLSFPTGEMRNEFFETFKDLIEEAKMFL